jgi:nucleoside-diphosphate-sugar epimerase
MRVFMTGATGYVGEAVARALIAGGHTVTGLARSDKAASALGRAGLDVVRGELDDVDVIEEQAATHDASVHAAYEHGDDRVALERTAIETMIAGARRVDEPRMVVMTSGIWTLGATGDVAADEDAKTERPAALSAHRPALERELLDASGSLATAVVRPGMVYGGRGGVIDWFERLVPKWSGLAAPAFLGDGSNRWSVVHRDDVGALYRTILEQRKSGLYHAVEDTPVRVIDLANALAANRAVHPWLVSIARNVIGQLADALAMDQVIAAPRAHALGWRPAHGPLMQTLDAVVQDYRKGDA